MADSCEQGHEPSVSIKWGKIPDSWSAVGVSKDCIQWTECLYVKRPRAAYREPIREHFSFLKRNFTYHASATFRPYWPWLHSRGLATPIGDGNCALCVFSLVVCSTPLCRSCLLLFGNTLVCYSGAVTRTRMFITCFSLWTSVTFPNSCDPHNTSTQLLYSKPDRLLSSSSGTTVNR